MVTMAKLLHPPPQIDVDEHSAPDAPVALEHDLPLVHCVFEHVLQDLQQVGVDDVGAASFFDTQLLATFLDNLSLVLLEQDRL